MTEEEILKKHLSQRGKKATPRCAKNTLVNSKHLLLREERIAGKTESMPNIIPEYKRAYRAKNLEKLRKYAREYNRQWRRKQKKNSNAKQFTRLGAEESAQS